MAQYKDEKTGKWYYSYISVAGTHLTKRGFATKGLAKKAEEASRGIKDYRDVKFYSACTQRLNSILANKAGESYMRMESMFRVNVKDHLPDKRMSAYTYRDITTMVNKLSKDGKTNKTINSAVEFVSGTFNYGIKNEYCQYNPCVHYTKLPEVKEEMKWWNEDEFNEVMKYEKDFERYCLYNFLFWTGMRKGEARALTWADFNPATGRIRINKHITDKDQLVVDGRKNYKGYSITVDEDVRDLLCQLRDHNSKIDGFKTTSIIFGTVKPLANETIRRHFQDDAKAAGMEPIRIHDLRHSHVSYLLNYTGLRAQDVASRIGDTVEVVLRTYAHFINNSDNTVVTAIEENKKNRPVHSISDQAKKQFDF